ncbi:hypothetical protein [Exiguobacterium antarcticum]|uniref:hypothetical protein n=1 Tax=Exiguobacterium antarcticum TaxID=132920 RepID=UPI0002D92150|nr:hypothetical protein [Exiguobacterium antarcticum]
MFLFASNEDITQAPKQAQDKPPAVQTTGAKIADVKQNESKKTAAVSQSETDKKIKELMKKGMVQTTPGGEQINNQFFYVDPLIETPKELDLKEKPGYRFVTVPVMLELDVDPEFKNAMSIYRPSTYAMTAPDGKEYLPIDYVNRNEKAWKFSYQYFSGKKSHVDLVYQVPEDAKVLVLYASDSAFPRTVTVKIELPPVSKALTDQEEQAVKQMMNKGVFNTYPGDPLQKKAVFHVDAMLPNPPKELKLKPWSGYQLVTLPLIFQDTYYDHDGSSVNYRPNTFTLQAPDGTEYEQIDYVNRNEKAWKNGFQYYPPFRSQIDFVFEVPDDQSVFVMYASSEAFPKPTTVKIGLD